MFSISRLSDTMKRGTGPGLKRLLEYATEGPIRGMTAGALVTFLVQSSSVTVLLLLGLVNAGAMRLNQAVYVVLGSEIGTTITAQIVACKVTVLFFPLIFLGFVMKSVFPGRECLRDGGEVLFSLGLVFLSMQIMSEGARPLRDLPYFSDLITRLGDVPLYGIIIGAIFTAITSSSSATTSLVIAMSSEGAIDLMTGITLVVGANIGTCVLELIAVAGSRVNAKRTGLAQFLINLIGALLIYPVLIPFADFVAHSATEVPRQIANGHLIFNLAVSCLLLPFTAVFIKLLKALIPGEDPPAVEISQGLDLRLLNIPAMALAKAEEEIFAMIHKTEEMLTLARRGFFTLDREAIEAVREDEKMIDVMNGRLTDYLNRISTLRLSNRERQRKRALMHSLTDIERIADLAENLVDYASRKQVFFTEQARAELEAVFDHVATVFHDAVLLVKAKRKIVHESEASLAEKWEILYLEKRGQYYRQVTESEGEPEADRMYPAVLRDLERIGGHALNIVEHFRVT